MALVKTETVEGFSNLPPLRQVGMMVGLAASVALGVAVVLWSQEPNYSLLYGGLSDRDRAAVAEALQQAGIEYQLDSGSGAVMVAADRVHDARLHLAQEGLPEGSGMGFELLQKEQGFGTSQFMENARYQHALEGELSRTIATMRNVHSARVHLAMPKRTVFARRQDPASASVLVNLASGRVLDEDRVASIVHLVAASVPNLEPENVSVVNQRGDLLTSRHSGEMGMSSSQFRYTRKVEETYVQRIEDLLSPLVGPEGVRAQVTADLDFTVTERTRESYDPETQVVRSEQTSEKENIGDGAGAAGIPGALSNQPPTTAAPQPEPAAGAAAQEQTEQNGAPTGPRNTSRNVTRNYELDKTISHTRLATGTIQRLSVAVVLDDKQVVNDAGEQTREPWSDAELERFTGLVREAVGFDGERGDSVTVTNASFKSVPTPEPLPEPAVWEEPWVWSLAKQLLAAAGVALLVLGVLRPVMRSLAEKGAGGGRRAVAAMAGAPGDGLAEDQVSLGQDQPGRLENPHKDYEHKLGTARNMVSQDPKRVAQVVKNWVGEDG